MGRAAGRGQLGGVFELWWNLDGAQLQVAVLVEDEEVGSESMTLAVTVAQCGMDFELHVVTTISV